MNFIRPVATFLRIIIWCSVDDFVAEAQFFSIFDILVTASYHFLPQLFSHHTIWLLVRI